MSSVRRHTCLSVLIAALCLAATAGAQTIAFITSDTLTSTKRTISGAKRIISSEHAEAAFHEYLLGGQISETKLIDSLSHLNVDLLIPVGSRATETVKKHFGNTPTVFSAVLYPAISGFVESLIRPGRQITGASLNISARTQFIYFKEIVPDLKRVGVLYTDQTASLIPPSKVLAEEEGLELIPIKITSEKEIAAAIDSLARSAQGIWSVADPLLFTPQATRFIVMRSIKRGVPFMGFSRHVVSSGALFAIDFDYKAIGRQTGRLANEVLNGTQPGDLSVTAPDVVWFHYNEKTASLLGIQVPDRLTVVAKEVYR